MRISLLMILMLFAVAMLIGKSKIEKILVESYTDNTFKYELKNFKTNVLDNRNISQIYYLYDEIKSKNALSVLLNSQKMLTAKKRTWIFRASH